ncbi:MAG: SMC-Scp complex subunit ScpB [Acidobacteriota bacterium]|nr:SMC-Scp complex subunit ScpB [Acidobacteriota bacterium]MDQ7086716.1 SMC-Scp complex subunit ScpB [Acidobacteriota bacterium]
MSEEHNEQFAVPEEAGKEPGAEKGLDILACLEAMLFVSPEPLAIREIQAALEGTGREEIEAGLEALAKALTGPGRGLRLEAVAGGYRLVTQPAFAAPLKALFRFRNRKRLTPAVLDVLAIVAYAQPITAPEIQEIRGTDPSYALRSLQERRLVRMLGRKKVVGRPILYGTTRHFLLHFGLDSLEDLPPVEAYGTRVVPAQGRLFPGEAVEVEPLDGEGAEAVEAGDEAGEGAATGDVMELADALSPPGEVEAESGSRGTAGEDGAPEGRMAAAPSRTEEEV